VEAIRIGAGGNTKPVGRVKASQRDSPGQGFGLPGAMRDDLIEYHVERARVGWENDSRIADVTLVALGPINAGAPGAGSKGYRKKLSHGPPLRG